MVDSGFWIHGILLGSGLLDPRYLDPGDPDPGILDSGHCPGCWLWWGKKRTAALLVKRTSAAVSALQYQYAICNMQYAIPTMMTNAEQDVASYLWAVQACSSGEAWMRVTKTT